MHSHRNGLQTWDELYGSRTSEVPNRGFIITVMHHCELWPVALKNERRMRVAFPSVKV